MGRESCDVLFSINDPQIPKDYKEEFTTLAKRAGNEGKVDSCDLQSLYNDKLERSSYRRMDRASFLKEISNPGKGTKSIFDFEAFHAHLALVEHGLIRFGDMWEGAQSKHDSKSFSEMKRGAEEFWKEIPLPLQSPILEKTLKTLCAESPYRELRVRGSGREQSLFISGVTDSSELILAVGPYFGMTFPITEYRSIFAYPDRSLLTMEVGPDGKGVMRRLDPEGNESGWIQFNLSALFRTDTNPLRIPQFAYAESRHSKLQDKEWQSIDIPVVVNMSRDQWHVIRKLDGATERLLDDRIEAIFKNRDAARPPFGDSATLNKLPIERVKKLLAPFDKNGLGDNDRHIEYADASPNPLAGQFHYYTQFFYHDEQGQFQKRHNFTALPQDQQQRARGVSQLWGALEELRRDMMSAQDTHDKIETLAWQLNSFRSRQVDVVSRDPGQGLEDKDHEKQLRDFIQSTWVALESMYGQEINQIWERERLDGHPTIVLGDSLTAGMQFAAVRAAKDLPAMAQHVLLGVGVRGDRISNIGFKEPYPMNTQALLEGGQSLTTTVLQMGRKFAFGAEPYHYNERREGKLSQVVIAGVPGATTHDIVADLSKEPQWQSPGRAFVEQLLKLYPGSSQDGSFLQRIVHEFQIRTTDSQKGGAFVVGLGANNLFGFHDIVLDVPDHDPTQYEDDLKALDRKTKLLSENGARKVYLFPPDVRSLLIPISEGSHFFYEDNTPVPVGSYTLFHWYISAKEHGLRIPRKNIVTADEYVQLGRRFQEMNEAAHRVLGQQSNWLIIDNDRKQGTWKPSDSFRPGVFSYLTEKLRTEGISFDLPGYGKVNYQGHEELLSPDNIHPSNFTYLFWSDLLVQSFANHHTFVDPQGDYTTREDLEDANPKLLGDVYEDIKKHIEYVLHKDPSAYRPSRMTYDKLKAWRTELAQLASKKDIDTLTRGELDTVIQRKWAYFNRDTLVEILTALEPSLEGLGKEKSEVALNRIYQANPLAGDKTVEQIKEHQLAHLIRFRLASLPAHQSSPAVVAIFKKTAVFANEMETDFWEQTRLAITFFNGGGPRGVERPREYHTGKTPGVLAPTLLQTGVAARIASPYQAQGLVTVGVEGALSAVPLSSFPMLNYSALYFSGRGTAAFSAQKFDYGELSLGIGSRFYNEGLPLSLAAEWEIFHQSHQSWGDICNRTVLRLSYHPDGPLYLVTRGSQWYVEGRSDNSFKESYPWIDFRNPMNSIGGGWQYNY